MWAIYELLYPANEKFWVCHIGQEFNTFCGGGGGGEGFVGDLKLYLSEINGAIATTTRLEIQRECLTAFDVFSYSMQSSSTSGMSLQCTLKFNNYLHFEKKKKNWDILFKKHKRKIRTFNKKN